MSSRRVGPRIGIGIDVGGTFTKIVAVTENGRLLRRLQVETLSALGPKAFVERISGAVASLRRDLPRAADAAGVGLAGGVDRRLGVLSFAPNMKSFMGFRFRPEFESRLGVPVAVDNDANMATWGGYAAELGRKYGNILCVTSGTGIGGGLVVEGRLFHGATGSAGEIGHTCVEPDGELCTCGDRGCVEAYAGAYGIVRTARKLLEHSPGRRSVLRRLCPDPGELTPRLLNIAARRKDSVARSTWEITGYYLGLGISNVVAVFNPDVVLLVGGVSAAGRFLLKPVSRVMSSRSMTVPFRHVRLKIGRTPDLGAVGCGLWALEEQSD